jgi:hypothetical protein
MEDRIKEQDVSYVESREGRHSKSVIAGGMGEMGQSIGFASRGIMQGCYM